MITFCDISGATATIVAGLIATRMGYPDGETHIATALAALCPGDAGNPGVIELVRKLMTIDGPTGSKVRAFFKPPSQAPLQPPTQMPTVSVTVTVPLPVPMVVQDSAAPALKMLGYTWLKLIGSGGFGRVHLVEDGSRKKYAVKQATSTQEASDEFAIMNALNIKNIPKVKACHGAFLVMDLVVGRDMKSMIPTSVGLACETGAAVGRLLMSLHSAGFTHGDIKPANVMVDAKGQFVLIDFGEAKKNTSLGRIASDVGMLGNLVRRCILGNDTDAEAAWPKRVPLGVRAIVDRARGVENQPALVDLVGALEKFKGEAEEREGVLEELESLYGSSDWLSETELREKTERRLNPGPRPSYIA